MRIEYHDITDLLTNDIHFLHDVERQKEYVKDKYPDCEHFEVVMMYRYKSCCLSGHCEICDSDLDIDWNYCPWCGIETMSDFTILKSSIDEVKKSYKNITGNKMEEENIDKITGQYTIKIWYEED